MNNLQPLWFPIGSGLMFFFFKKKNHKLPYLTNYHIIWATIIVQLLVPFLHHAILAVIVSLMVESGRLNAKGDVTWATRTHTYACIWVYMQQYNLDTWITSISSRIFCPVSPWPLQPTCAISSLTTSRSLGWFKYTLCNRLVNLSWASLIHCRYIANVEGNINTIEILCITKNS